MAWMRNRSGDIFTSSPLAGTFQQPVAVVTADLDRDGKMDVISSDASGDRITWHHEIGTRWPWFNPVALPGAFNGAFALDAADLDRDGDSDIIYTAQGDKEIGWLENEGTSPLKFTRHALTNAALEPSCVATADLDGDGDTDILAASVGDDTFWFFENDGATHPAFTTRKLHTRSPGARAICAADLDGDGDRDVVCASRDDNTIAWLRNNGARPPLFLRTIVTTSATAVRAVAAADLDRDGDTDLLAAEMGADTLAWFENNGAPYPSFTRRVITDKAPGVWSVRAADLDGDGDPDPLVSTATDGTILWFENDLKGAGRFWRRRVGLEGKEVRDAAAADLDGDGDLDVIGAIRAAGAIKWYPNIKPQAPRASGARDWARYG